MLRLPESVRVLLFPEPCDMRKGFDGLAALVLASGEDIFGGHLFVFVSKRGDRLKVLSWDRGGFVLWYRRLERGCFRVPESARQQGRVELDTGQMAMLLDGVDYSRLQRPRVWKPSRPAA